MRGSAALRGCCPVVRSRLSVRGRQELGGGVSAHAFAPADDDSHRLPHCAQGRYRRMHSFGRFQQDQSALLHGRISIPRSATAESNRRRIVGATALIAPTLPIRMTQRRTNSSRANRRKAKDDNAPLLNEHLIAELFNMKKRENVTVESYEVRLIVDPARPDRGRGGSDGGGDESDDQGGGDGATPRPTTEVCTLNRALDIAHERELDLMEVNLRQDPPVLRAVDYDRLVYDRKRQATKAAREKRERGGGAISDRQVKEFKFRAGIADHDLGRKTANMMRYLEKGHAIRVTLTARRRSLNSDADAIQTTLDRVKELVGDLAVEARGMKANDRKSFGSLLLHPSKK